ncbi:methyltransferase domain-containing protein [Amycolatopsis halotolerans]|uniref:Methyltransferase domain-containing protein n=1 Tax=Amycolatopsis halotolerans TaxID=330083 RepID=A0ABV7QEF7_9PSEU
MNRFQDLDAGPGHRVEDYLDTVRRLHTSHTGPLEAAVRADPGLSVLDVGCGVGGRLLELARAGHRGELVGIDRSELVLAEARRRCAAEGHAVTFVHADAADSEFDADFDLVHSERVLIHVEDVETVVAAYRRAVKVGGKVIVSEPHASALAVNVPDIPLTNAVFGHAHGSLRNPWVSARLPSLLRAAGFADVSTTGWVGITESLPDFDRMLQLTRWSEAAVAAGSVDAGGRDRWHAQLESAQRRGEFLGSWTVFTSQGTRA